MSKRLLGLPREIIIVVTLNALTFVIYVLTAKNQENYNYLLTKNLFVFSVILTVIVLFIANIKTSWRLGREFYLKKKYFYLFGQIAIALLTMIIAGNIVAYLIKNFITY